MRLRQLTKYIIFPIALWILAGCARFPADTHASVVRSMSFQITYDGPVDENAYYFTVIDIHGAGTGPLPVFPNPEVPAGNDWVTGSATHFVMYHQRQYTLYRIDHLNPLQYAPIGVPIRSSLPDPGSSTLNFTIDLDAIGATDPTVDINIISLNQLSPDGRLLDALGPLGGDFLNLDIRSNRTFRNSELSRPEGPDDVLNQNGISQLSTGPTKSIDILDWTITTSVY